MTFASLGLSDPLLRALVELGYRLPTPVQLAAIPAIMRGRDLWASAQTGSGKTAAFVLPILERLSTTAPSERGAVQALILVPTRELAVQTGQAIARYGRKLPVPLTTCVAVGGVAIERQLRRLADGVQLLVATPGRLLDLIDQNAVQLSSLQTLVLDEADRLLSLGFAEQLAALLALLPSDSQRLLFSATFPPKVVALAEKLLREPCSINIDAGATPAADVIEQRVIEVDAGQRTALLQHLLRVHAWPQLLVFVASRLAADELALTLSRAGTQAWPLHGELGQDARTQTLTDFKAGRFQVLVATDLAARGLDIVQLPAVLNFDLPRSAADYTHRIGRTGRAGETGVALSFVSAATAAHFRLIEKRHRIALEREQIPGFEPSELALAGQDENGGIKGKRKSKKDKLREALARATSNRS
ncbi:MAG: rhlE [Myxococcaceae bacterium]|nr:rhlE [Myxococcaceae bacterium]